MIMMIVFITIKRKKLFKVASEKTFYLCLVCLRLQALICLWQDLNLFLQFEIIDGFAFTSFAFLFWKKNYVKGKSS